MRNCSVDLTVLVVQTNGLWINLRLLFESHYEKEGRSGWKGKLAQYRCLYGRLKENYKISF